MRANNIESCGRHRRAHRSQRNARQWVTDTMSIRGQAELRGIAIYWRGGESERATTSRDDLMLVELASL